VTKHRRAVSSLFRPPSPCQTQVARAIIPFRTLDESIAVAARRSPFYKMAGVLLSGLVRDDP
jgi:hypothetical protein